MLKTLPIAAGLIAGSLLSGAAGAATTEELERRIQELEQTVRLLNRKQEVSEEIYVADKSRAATAGTVKAGLDGFALVSPDKQAELKLRGLLQFDGRFGLDDDKDADTFLFRRVRPTLEGNTVVVAGRDVVVPARDELAARAAAIEARFGALGLPARKWLRMVRPYQPLDAPSPPAV